MRVLVTGANGFVGGWLMAELASAGHDAIAAPLVNELDLSTSPDLAPLIGGVRPDAVAHLAAMTFVPDTTADPGLARRVNVDGTRALAQGLDDAGSDAALLVTSSAEVYGEPERLPVAEDAALRPRNPYAETKVAQERVALASAALGRRVIVTRAFNHIGPGQRPSFVAPALARRVLALKAGRIASIAVGRLDVRRDFTDVRDVVVAYRLLLEAAGKAPIAVDPPVFNVGSGRSVPIAEILSVLCRLAGIEPRSHVEQGLVRPTEIADSYADLGRIRALINWTPTIPLEQSLRDILVAETG